MQSETLTRQPNSSVTGLRCSLSYIVLPRPAGFEAGTWGSLGGPLVRKAEGSMVASTGLAALHQAEDSQQALPWGFGPVQ